MYVSAMNDLDHDLGVDDSSEVWNSPNQPARTKLTAAVAKGPRLPRVPIWRPLYHMTRQKVLVLFSVD